jgi:hypothetical protein
MSDEPPLLYGDARLLCKAFLKKNSFSVSVGRSVARAAGRALLGPFPGWASCQSDPWHIGPPSDVKPLRDAVAAHGLGCGTTPLKISSTTWRLNSIVNFLRCFMVGSITPSRGRWVLHSMSEN